MKIVHRVPADAAAARLDRYLADSVGISRARVKEAFDAGEVRVDGRRARKGDRVVAGSEVTAEVPGEPAPPVPESQRALRVLLEDPAFVVLDKPAGEPTHPLREEETGTLANALVARYPECATAGADPREAGLAHRLDVETSGAIVAARSAAAFAKLREAFSQRRVVKRYVALVSGAPGEGGEIGLPIAHHPSNPRKMITCSEDEDAVRLKAREALTRYQVIERLGDYALVEAEIPTGVMHQIRVHLAAIGAPVAGDPLYGGATLEGLERQFLHAAKLEFPHPETGARVLVEAPLPPELANVLARLRGA